jgi:hypothetical protein
MSVSWLAVSFVVGSHAGFCISPLSLSLSLLSRGMEMYIIQEREREAACTYNERERDRLRFAWVSPGVVCRADPGYGLY